MGNRDTALRTNTFAARTSAGAIAFPAAASTTAAHASACSGPHSPRSRSITSWHTNLLLYGWLLIYDCLPMPAWADTEGPLIGLSSPCLNFSTASRAEPVRPT